jgi:hypothetical protein
MLMYPAMPQGQPAYHLATTQGSLHEQEMHIAEQHVVPMEYLPWSAAEAIHPMYPIRSATPTLVTLDTSELAQQQFVLTEGLDIFPSYTAPAPTPFPVQEPVPVLVHGGDVGEEKKVKKTGSVNTWISNVPSEDVDKYTETELKWLLASNWLQIIAALLECAMFGLMLWLIWDAEGFVCCMDSPLRDGHHFFGFRGDKLANYDDLFANRGVCWSNKTTFLTSDEGQKQNALLFDCSNNTQFEAACVTETNAREHAWFMILFALILAFASVASLADKNEKLLGTFIQSKRNKLCSALLRALCFGITFGILNAYASFNDGLYATHDNHDITTCDNHAAQQLLVLNDDTLAKSCGIVAYISALLGLVAALYTAFVHWSVYKRTKGIGSIADMRRELKRAKGKVVDANDALDALA